jgi:hypothetical protein
MDVAPNVHADGGRRYSGAVCSARSPAARPRRDGREERWLLTEQNRFINSTMKMVRGRIEEP